MNLFKKAVVFTDIHFGLKSNSMLHLQDCDEYITWMIKIAKEEGCETCIFSGDWHHNRSSLNIITLNHSMAALERVSKAFDVVHFIPGNHDLYYKDRRDVQSAVWAKHIPNINVINDITSEGDVTIVPWLVGDDHKAMKKIRSKYVFGHFELPHFFMNAMVQMPDGGDLQQEHFRQAEFVYSGHFHKRQTMKNITYLGNAFPHNYADKDDDERGFMLLEWGEEPRYFNWLDGPKYRVFNLSELVDDAGKYLAPKMYCRVNIDMKITYEEANFIKEEFAKQYKLRELSLVPIKECENQEIDGEIKFESVDQIVITELTNVVSDTFDPHRLMTMYQDL